MAKFPAPMNAPATRCRGPADAEDRAAVHASSDEHPALSPNNL